MIEQEYKPFPSIPRLAKHTMVITEKIDGTNAQIVIGEDGSIRAGSRTRWLTVDADNFGFAKWVEEHKDELLALGPGSHAGEWWGAGIQRRYGLAEKRFSLFNTGRWGVNSPPPACCGVVPVLATHTFSDEKVDEVMEQLRTTGSVAAPGFMDPEGIVIYLTGVRTYFKKTFKGDGGKWTQAQEAAQ